MSKKKAKQKDFTEIKRKLGFNLLAHLNLFCGIPYHLPDWFLNSTPLIKTIWKAWCHIGYILLYLMIISNVFEAIQKYDKLAVVLTCVRIIVYMISVGLKLVISKNQIKVFDKVKTALFDITYDLMEHPINEKKNFFVTFDKYSRGPTLMGRMRVLVVSIILPVFVLILYIYKTDNKTLPTNGWYPFDYTEPFYYFLAYLFQLICFYSILLKDSMMDNLVLTILVTLNSQLIYLRKLLGQIVKLNEKVSCSVDISKQEAMLIWWAKQHQAVLRLLDYMKPIANTFLFVKYVSTGTTLFIGGILLTSRNIEYSRLQQIVMNVVNCVSLLIAFYFGVTGDHITENADKLLKNGLHSDIIMTKRQSIRKNYLLIATAVSRPVKIHLGYVSHLSISSFGNIAKIALSYFITIIQIRDKGKQNSINPADASDFD